MIAADENSRPDEQADGGEKRQEGCAKARRFLRRPHTRNEGTKEEECGADDVQDGATQEAPEESHTGSRLSRGDGAPAKPDERRDNEERRGGDRRGRAALRCVGQGTVMQRALAGFSPRPSTLLLAPRLRGEDQRRG